MLKFLSTPNTRQALAGPTSDKGSEPEPSIRYRGCLTPGAQRGAPQKGVITAERAR
ncbi:hypothetical protein D9M71_802090 [compost metagenome]